MRLIEVALNHYHHFDEGCVLSFVRVMNVVVRLHKRDGSRQARQVPPPRICNFARTSCPQLDHQNLVHLVILYHHLLWMALHD